MWHHHRPRPREEFCTRPKQVRLDTTSASGYWPVSADGLFQFGHSKDHRPDLPQLKVMLATRDPLGLPLATDVLAGQQAHDPAYLPAIARVRDSLQQAGLLYIGDCKMAALLTRATLAAQGDYYLCPLAALQVPQQELLARLAACCASQQPPTEIVRRAAAGNAEVIAESYEQMVPLVAQVAGRPVQWQERRLLVYSFAAAHTAEAGVPKRLTQAQAELATLTEPRQGKRRIVSLAELEPQAAAVLKRQRVEGLLVRCQQQVHTRTVRAYKDAPSRQVEAVRLQREVTRDETAIRAAVQALGWRVYATNAPAQELSSAQAVLAYREEYLVERSFRRLKGAPWSLTPMYLERDEHATGLVRLLSSGLRALSLLEYEVRRRLTARGEVLAGLYAGNPKRTTAWPTAEGLLGGFQEITLTVIEQAGAQQVHLTPLNALQQRVLALLGFSPAISLRLVEHSSQPP